MNTMILKARGKVNLGLDVLRRREDGYHEVRMIMQTVGLFDKIRLQRRSEPGIVVKAANRTFVPLNENNLAYKAADLLMQEFHVKDGLEISLEKHIPVAAGMAGGSADAAAVLYGVNRIFRLGLSMEELKERGVKIGADVPYCLMRGTALAEGIGEKLTVLPPVPECTVLVAKPPINVSTKWVYTHLTLNENTVHPDIDLLLDCLERGDIETLAANMGNVLQDVTEPEYPVISEIKEMMHKYGCMGAMMSGSGPTVFGLFKNRGQAEACRRSIMKNELSREVYCTCFFNTKDREEGK